jgi:DNA-binding transcriptional regulator PaaX
MTVIDELMVLLDDHTTRTLDECAFVLPERTRQTLSSTLGRLVAKGWVVMERDRLRRINTYTITDSGTSTVTKTLQHLKLVDDSTWNHQWMFVFFNIPEKQRKFRDVLRNRLTNIGFGRIQNSVWAAARDVRFEFEDLLSIKTIQACITIIQPTLSEDDERAVLAAFDWDWNVLNKEYQRFIEKSDIFLATKEKNGFQAKSLVYSYAKLLSQDPKLPSHLEPTEYHRKKAHSCYKKVQPHCY